MWHWRHKSSPTRNNDRSIDRTSLPYHFICVRRSTMSACRPLTEWGGVRVKEKALVNCSATPCRALESFTVMTQLTRVHSNEHNRSHTIANMHHKAGNVHRYAPLPTSTAQRQRQQWLEGRAGFIVCKHTTPATTTAKISTTATITRRATTTTTDKCYSTLMGSTLSASVYTRARRI